LVNNENKIRRIISFDIFSVPSKPTFSVIYKGPTFFNISFDPTIMTVPGSHYYVQFKENDKGF
jgi:hypothetical protein